MKNLLLIILLSCSILANSQPFPGYIGGSSYENSNTTTGFQGEQSYGAAAMERSTFWKKTGTYSLKIRYSKTDGPAPSSVGGGYRVEHFHNYPKLRTDITWFRQWWYIPSTTYADDPAPEILWQYHKGSGSPPVSIQIKNGRLQFLVYYQSDTLDLGPVPKNQGFELVWHLVPSTTSSGLLEIWMNGVKKYTRNGANTTGTTEQYFKTGIYKWNWDPTWSYAPLSTSTLREFYVDDYAFGQEGVTTFSGITLTTPPVTNQPPSVTVTSPVITLNSATSASLSGSASDPDGTIDSVRWSQVSGPNTATITSPTTGSTNVTGLVIGTYVFRLTAYDNSGASASANVTVQVNNPPTIAFSQSSITLGDGVNSVTLSPTLTDPDGNIANATKLWQQVYGPTAATIVSPTGSSTVINGLVDGTYTFRITVTDEDGGVAIEEVDVTKTSIYIISPKSRKKVVPTGL